MYSLLASTTARAATRSLAPSSSLIINSRVPLAATTTAASSVIKRSYHENIVEHYENPRNVGSLDKNDRNVGTVSAWTFVHMDMHVFFWS